MPTIKIHNPTYNLPPRIVTADESCPRWLQLDKDDITTRLLKVSTNFTLVVLLGISRL